MNVFILTLYDIGFLTTIPRRKNQILRILDLDDVVVICRLVDDPCSSGCRRRRRRRLVVGADDADPEVVEALAGRLEAGRDEGPKEDLEEPADAVELDVAAAQTRDAAPDAYERQTREIDAPEGSQRKRQDQRRGAVAPQFRVRVDLQRT